MHTFASLFSVLVCILTNAFQFHQGHFEGELWGLATNPSNSNYYVTVGDDRTIRIWDVKKRCNVTNETGRYVSLDEIGGKQVKARCIAWGIL